MAVELKHKKNRGPLLVGMTIIGAICYFFPRYAVLWRLPGDLVLFLMFIGLWLGAGISLVGDGSRGGAVVGGAVMAAFMLGGLLLMTSLFAT